MKNINEPLVSIVTPVYNHALYINDYIDSLLIQDYQNIELVIIDDFSEDNSAKIIEKRLNELSSKIKKVIFIKNEKNLGVIKNCNLGLKKSTGKYICFFASDDIMLPNRILKNVEILNSNDDIYFTFSKTLFLVDKKIKKIKQKKLESNNLFIDLLVHGNFISAPTITYRREGFTQLGFFDETLIAEDYDMLLRFSRQFKSQFINEFLCIYRLRHGSLSNTIQFKVKINKNNSNVRSKYISSSQIDEKVKNKIENNESFRSLKTSFFYLLPNFKEEIISWNAIKHKQLTKTFIIYLMRIVFMFKNIHKIIVFFSLLAKYRNLQSVSKLLMKKENHG